ncbi:hypothetical protein HNR12_003903 [Streptomonospora nanhaiensis]|uniref:Peptidase inhibitor family I36 n=1 Tax=Streptomonospora nanhaiensis TaxID=1323731 RepID=A0A853BSD3_9ACTN|nr:peptidase inhibitor family I36 protein [Streptomonospora nanhaiensis]NYI97626.1 hypothetical protein [Streptomonospora nanhaiensis]
MRGLLRTTFLSAAALAALAAAPVAASAASAPPDCSPGSICGYTEYGFRGEPIPLKAGVGCVNLQVPIRSIANTYGSPGIPAAAAVYDSPGCTGGMVAQVGQEQSDTMIIPDGVSVYLVW